MDAYARSQRSHAPPSTSAHDDAGPLSQERHMMERIREKLERAQLRLARQHAAQSATPGSSRYYPPNYESARARTPAPPVQSVKLEDFSLHYAPPPPSAAPSSSAYLGAYPPQSQAAHMTSRRHHHQSQRPPPPPPTTTARPSRQSVPQGDPTRSSRHHHHHQQQQRRQYPPELQYKSASRNTAVPGQPQGAPLSTSAPFLVYSSTAARHQTFAPPSPMQVPQSQQQQHHHHRHDRTREPPASAMRSALQPPPSSRVRFEGDDEEEEKAEQQRKKEQLARVEKAKERQREKELALREMLRNERQKRAVSRDAAESQQQQEQLAAERPERTRRGSLPTPPKSEIDASAAPLPLSPTAGSRPRRNSLVGVVPPKSEIDASAAPFPLSPSGGRPRRNSLASVVPPKSEIDASMFQPLPSPSGGRGRRTTSAAAVPPPSAIQASAFEEAPIRRRSSAADEQKQRTIECSDANAPAAATSAEREKKVSAKQRDVSSDEDEYTTPPTSPSSGGSASSSQERDSVPSKKVEELPLFDLVAAAPEAPKHAPEDQIPVNVKPVAKDYDDELFGSNQQDASPAAKKKQLSIWEEDDEEEIITSLNQRPSPRHQQQQTPRGDRQPVLIWDDGDELDDGDEIGDVEIDDDEQQPEADPLSSQEPSPAKTDVVPLSLAGANQDHQERESSGDATSQQTKPASPQQDAAPVMSSPTKSNQELSPVKSPVASRVPAHPGSRPRPDLRSRISAALQTLKAPDQTAAAESSPNERPPALPASSRPSVPPASSRPAVTITHSPVAPPVAHSHPASEPRAAPAVSVPPSRTSAAVPRPPSTTVGRPSVSRPRTPPLPPAPVSAHPRSYLMAPPSSRASMASANGAQSQRRVRHREPLDLKMQLPPQIGVLAGLSSGPITFPMNESAFYEIEWRTGEFGFSFQRVYSEECDESGKSEMFLRMLLNTDRGTCKSFRDVRVGDILIQIGDVKVSDLGFDSARDPGSALTKYFTELRMQTPMRLVFQRMEVLDWEGGVEL